MMTTGSTLHTVYVATIARLTVELFEKYQMRQKHLAAERSLTVAEFNLLAMLNQERDFSMHTLAQKLGVSNSRLSRVMEGLARKGLVARTPCARDRRIQLVRLTERGASLRGDLEREFLCTQESVLRTFPEKDVQTVASVMEKLNAALGEA